MLLTLSRYRGSRYGPRSRRVARNSAVVGLGILLSITIAACGPTQRQLEAEVLRQRRLEDSAMAGRPPVNTPCSAERVAALTSPRPALHATLNTLDHDDDLPVGTRAAIVESVGRRRLKIDNVSEGFVVEIRFTLLESGAIDSLLLRSTSGQSELDEAFVRAVLSAAYTRGLPSTSGRASPRARRLLLVVMPGEAPEGAWPFPHPSTLAPDTADLPAKLALPLTPIPYPRSLRDRFIQGSVMMELMVDATGAPVPETFTLVSATHPEFADAVLHHLPTLRYLPAVAGECTVPSWVVQPFAFRVRR